jgi:hypothetical protein
MVQRKSEHNTVQKWAKIRERKKINKQVNIFDSFEKQAQCIFYTCAEENFNVLLYTYSKVGLQVHRYPIHTYTVPVPYKCTETKQIITIFWLRVGTFLTEKACWRMSIRGTKTRTLSSHILKKQGSTVLDGVWFAKLRTISSSD